MDPLNDYSVCRGYLTCRSCGTFTNEADTIGDDYVMTATFVRFKLLCPSMFSR
jgi:hypothetical protein